jgi:hypothetical protein
LDKKELQPSDTSESGSFDVGYVLAAELKAGIAERSLRHGPRKALAESWRCHQGTIFGGLDDVDEDRGRLRNPRAPFTE